MRELKSLFRFNLVLLLIVLLLLQPVCSAGLSNPAAVLLRLDRKWVPATRIWNGDQVEIYATRSEKVLPYVVSQILPTSCGCLWNATDGCLWDSTGGNLWSLTSGSLWCASNGKLWKVIKDCERTTYQGCLWCGTSGNLWMASSSDLWSVTSGSIWLASCGQLWAGSHGCIWPGTGGNLLIGTAGNLLQYILRGYWPCYNNYWMTSAGDLWGLTGNNVLEQYLVQLMIRDAQQVYRSTDGNLQAVSSKYLKRYTNNHLFAWLVHSSGKVWTAMDRLMMGVTNGDLLWEGTNGNLWFGTYGDLWSATSGRLWSSVRSRNQWRATTGNLWVGTGGTLWSSLDRRDTALDNLLWRSLLENNRWPVTSGTIPVTGGELISTTAGQLQNIYAMNFIQWFYEHTKGSNYGNLWFIDGQRMWVTTDGELWFVLEGDGVQDYLDTICGEEPCDPEGGDPDGGKIPPGRKETEEERWIPEEIPDEILPQTGAVHWPIYVFSALGGGSILWGTTQIVKGKKKYGKKE